MNRRIVTIIIALLLLTFSAGTNASAQEVSKSSKTLTKNLKTYLTAMQENKNFHGSILVANHGEILLGKGYGMANFEEKIKNTSETKFAIGSITKQFTAMAIMQLYESGKLNLGDKLSKYIPDFPIGDKITIHNLLTHTSGLVNFTDLPEFYTMKTNEMNKDRIIDLFMNLPLKFTPGKKYEYCNSGYVLLDKIIEIVSKLSYEDYLKENIFSPLGMRNTGLISNNGQELQKVTGYAGFLDVLPITDDIIARATFGAGSLYSTIGDLYQWDRALYTDKLLKKRNVQAMFKGYVKTPEGSFYGYGWGVTESSYGTVLSHAGGTSGFSSYILRFIDRDFTIIILTNAQSYDVATLANTLFQIAHGKAYTLPGPLVTAKIDKSLYKDYIGQYEISTDSNIEITTDGDHIYAQITGQNKLEIFPLTKSKFYYKLVDAEITFQRDSDGKVKELIFQQDGISTKLVKSKNTKPVKTAVAVEKEILDSYVGEYSIDQSTTVTITSAEGHLYALITGQDRFEIFAESDEIFFYKEFDTKIKFLKDAQGKVISLDFLQPEGNTTCVKIK